MSAFDLEYLKQKGLFLELGLELTPDQKKFFHVDLGVLRGAYSGTNAEQKDLAGKIFKDHAEVILDILQSKINELESQGFMPADNIENFAHFTMKRN